VKDSGSCSQMTSSCKSSILCFLKKSGIHFDFGLSQGKSYDSSIQCLVLRENSFEFRTNIIFELRQSEHHSFPIPSKLRSGKLFLFFSFFFAFQATMHFRKIEKTSMLVFTFYCSLSSSYT